MKFKTPLSLACLFLLLTITGSTFAQRKAHGVKAAPATAHDAATLGRMIEQAAAEAGISPHLLTAVVRQESSGKWWVVSHKGAAGLAQLMPGTAARFGVRNRFNPMENLRGGARYLRYLLDYFKGDVKLALAGYNAGEGAVNKYGGRIPPYRETQDYVAKIYPRFVREATAAGRTGVVQTSYRSQETATALRQVPVQVNSKAMAMVLAGERGAGIQDRAAETDELPAKDKGREPKEAARSTGASVYFWPAPARLSVNVIPQ